jgi:hypothetical protein
MTSVYIWLRREGAGGRRAMYVECGQRDDGAGRNGGSRGGEGTGG